MKLLFYGWKFNWTNSVDSWADDDHFHFSTASVAALTSKGLPPMTLVDFTAPLGATTTAIFTVPLICSRRAKSGYAGIARFTTLRVLPDCSCWATALVVSMVELPTTTVNNANKSPRRMSAHC